MNGRRSHRKLYSKKGLIPRDLAGKKQALYALSLGATCSKKSQDNALVEVNVMDADFNRYNLEYSPESDVVDLPLVPIMLVVAIAAARWTVLRLAVPSVPSARLGMGGGALVFMLVAEFGLVLWLRGLSIREYLAARDPVSGTVYYLMLAVFAAMPLLVQSVSSWSCWAQPFQSSAAR